MILDLLLAISNDRLHTSSCAWWIQATRLLHLVAHYVAEGIYRCHNAAHDGQQLCNPPHPWLAEINVLHCDELEPHTLASRYRLNAANENESMNENSFSLSIVSWQDCDADAVAVTGLPRQLRWLAVKRSI